jgi:hypothetical protein
MSWPKAAGSWSLPICRKGKGGLVSKAPTPSRSRFGNTSFLNRDREGVGAFYAAGSETRACNPPRAESSKEMHPP